MTHSRSYWPLVLTALAGVIVYWILTYAPMLAGEDPEASVHRIDRSGAEEAALRFAKERLQGETELEAFAVYASEREAFGYLYQNDAANTISASYQNLLPLELYRVELLEPETDLRHTVDINPYTGEAVEWSLQSYGEPLSEDELIRRAERALEASGLKKWASLVSADADIGEAVYDIVIPELKGATVQTSLQIDSGGIYSLQTRWYTPEAYTAEVERQDFMASLLGLSGLGLSAALQLAALIYAIRFGSTVSWRRGAFLSVVFAVFYCFTNINMLPGIKAMMQQIGSGEDFIVTEPGGDRTEVLFGLIFGLAGTNFLILLLAAGLYFSMVAGVRMISRRGWQLWPSGSDGNFGSHAVSSMWKGYAFAFILLGMQSVIFVAAERSFGTWYTIDAATSPNNLLFPALMPVLAWCAAISEEGVYRLFGIPALKAIFRFTFPAVLVSSMIWALGHVQYPIYPYYTRFVEVTLIGFLFSYVFLKHGFMTAVFAHAIADTIMMAISITAYHPSTGNWMLAVLYIASPIAIAYAMSTYGRRRTPSHPAGKLS